MITDSLPYLSSLCTINISFTFFFLSSVCLPVPFLLLVHFVGICRGVCRWSISSFQEVLYVSFKRGRRQQAVLFFCALCLALPRDRKRHPVRLARRGTLHVAQLLSSLSFLPITSIQADMADNRPTDASQVPANAQVSRNQAMTNGG